MHQLIVNKQTEIAMICQRFKVARLEVFGSAARATDFDPATSDIDFLVEYPRPLQPGFFDRWLQLQRDLQTVLECKVDLMLKGEIENPYLKQSMDEDREVVFEA